MGWLASCLGVGERRGARAWCVTWRLAAGQPPLGPRERDLVFEAVLAGNGTRCDVFALVVMDDHVHVLFGRACTTARQVGASWAARSSNQLQRLHRRRPPLWANRLQVDAVEGHERVRAVADSILGNPWKRWPFLAGYPWVYVQDWRVENGELRIET